MVSNLGRQIQFINGINGVSAGGNPLINMDVNKRYHRNKLLCSAVNYTGGTALATTVLTGSGANNLTVTPTVVNGVITAVAVVAGGTGYVTGDTVSITDATGTGFVGTVTAAAGVVTAVAVTVAGTASPVSPATFFSAFKQVVNGVIIRDISPTSILQIAIANGYYPALGELPLYYTDPADNINQLNEITSWDLFGQSTFSLQGTIPGTVSLPSLIGAQEFDNSRNLRPTSKGLIPFLQPIAQHEYTFNVVAGVNLINTIPFDYPIRRIWIKGSTPLSITQLEVDQDSNKVMEATYSEMRKMYEDYGFQFGKPNWANTTTTNAFKAAYQTPSYFDFAYISDPDRRLQKSLTCENSLVLRITSSVAQSVTIVMEYMPGQYAS